MVSAASWQELLQSGSLGCCSWQLRSRAAGVWQRWSHTCDRGGTLLADPIRCLAFTAGHARLKSSRHLLLHPKIRATQKNVASKNTLWAMAVPACSLFSSFSPLAFSYLSAATGCKGRTQVAVAAATKPRGKVLLRAVLGLHGHIAPLRAGGSVGSAEKGQFTAGC